MDDDVVDDAVLLRLLRAHEVVALHVLRDAVERLVRVVGDDLLHPALERDHLARLDLDVGALPLEPAGHLVDQDLCVRQRHPLPFRAAGARSVRLRSESTGSLRYSLLAGVHKVIADWSRSFSGVQSFSRAAARSAGIRFTSDATRSSAWARRTASRSCSQRPDSRSCGIASSASS